MLRQIREARMVEASELANFCGVTIGAVYRWERGEVVPRIRHKRKLIELFNTDIDLLLRPADAPGQEALDLGGGA